MNNTVIQNELLLLRSAVISIVGKDPEGEYKPSFVSEMLKTSTERSAGAFSSARQFLTVLKKA